MTPNEYRREGAEAMRAAAEHQADRDPRRYMVAKGRDPEDYVSELSRTRDSIRAIDVDAVLAGLTPAPDTMARLVEAARALVSIVEGIDGAMNHGTWRDERGVRLKDTPEWVGLYNALAAMEADHD